MTIETVTTHSFGRYAATPLVLVALEPRSYSQAVGGAVGGLRPNLDVLVVEPDELDHEVGRREPCLVLSARPQPERAAVRWAQLRPYEDPDVVRVDGVARRFREVELEDLVGLVDSFCTKAEKAAG